MSRIFRFADFELDSRSGELRKRGRRLDDCGIFLVCGVRAWELRGGCRGGAPGARMIAGDPFFFELESDARYQDLMARLCLPIRR
jgi:hypothetical protein